MTWLFSGWLPNSEVEPADFSMFEQYVNDPRVTPPAELQTHLYLFYLSVK
ncbi:GyrI-like domain-containing protein [Serratia sp. DD3]